jgi:ribosomal protein S26
LKELEGVSEYIIRVLEEALQAKTTLKEVKSSNGKGGRGSFKSRGRSCSRAVVKDKKIKMRSIKTHVVELEVVENEGQVQYSMLLL